MNVKYAGENKVMTELLMKELRNFNVYAHYSFLAGPAATPW